MSVRLPLRIFLLGMLLATAGMITIDTVLHLPPVLWVGIMLFAFGLRMMHDWAMDNHRANHLDQIHEKAQRAFEERYAQGADSYYQHGGDQPIMLIEKHGEDR